MIPLHPRTALLTCFLLSAGAGWAHVQNVSNIRVDLRSESEVIITYDLDGEAGAQYEIRVFLLREDDPAFRLRLSNAVGDIGRGRSAGKDLRISWNSRADFPEAIEGAQYRFEFEVSRHLPLPRLFAVLPAAAEQGQTLRLELSGDHFTRGVSTVEMGSGIKVSAVEVRSTTQLLVDITVGAEALAGSRTIRVVNDAERGDVSEALGFTIRESGGFPWYYFAAGGAGVAGVIIYFTTKKEVPASPSVTVPLPAPPDLP